MITQAEFIDLADEAVKDVLAMLAKKGKEYAPGANAFENMEDGAMMTGLDPKHYLMVLANKQWYVIMQWCRGRRPNTPPKTIRERVFDVIVYMLLLACMLDQTEQTKEGVDANK